MPRLTDDELANAVTLVKMSEYAAGGPSFYSLADASQDRYLDLCIAQAAASGEDVVAVAQVCAGFHTISFLPVRRPDLVSDRCDRPVRRSGPRTWTSRPRWLKRPASCQRSDNWGSRMAMIVQPPVLIVLPVAVVTLFAFASLGLHQIQMPKSALVTLMACPQKISRASAGHICAFSGSLAAASGSVSTAPGAGASPSTVVV